MELIEFLIETDQQSIVARNIVTVRTDNSEITGSLIPFTQVISRDGQTLSNIIHERDKNLQIVIKTLPDGIGPDVGNPILISEIVSITKED